MSGYTDMNIEAEEEDLQQFEKKETQSNSIPEDLILNVLEKLTDEELRALCVKINVAILQEINSSELSEDILSFPSDLAREWVMKKVQVWQRLGVSNCLIQLILNAKKD